VTVDVFICCILDSSTIGLGCDHWTSWINII